MESVLGTPLFAQKPNVWRWTKAKLMVRSNGVWENPRVGWTEWKERTEHTDIWFEEEEKLTEISPENATEKKLVPNMQNVLKVVGTSGTVIRQPSQDKETNERVGYGWDLIPYPQNPVGKIVPEVPE